jgi:hypothetical protein
VTPIQSHGSRPTSVLARRLAAALAALAVLAVLALGPAVSGAGAVVVEAEGVSAGLQPRSTTLLDGVEDPELLFKHPQPLQFANAAGSAVVAAAKIYAVYWDPTDHYHGDWQELIDGFLHNMGAESGSLESVFAVDSQYTDKANQHANYHSVFMGASVDTEPYPAAKCDDPDPMTGRGYPSGELDQIACLTDAQIREQLQSFIAKHDLAKGMETIFYVLTPPGVTVCLNAGGASGHCSDYHVATYTGTESQLEKEAKETEEKTSYKNSFCSYHSDINPDDVLEGDANTILYGVIPWTAGGLADGHLAEGDERGGGYACQDGGYNPTSNPIELLEEKKEKTAQQEKEIGEKTLEEQKKIRTSEALEGPHEEQPNQLAERGSDGFYDHGLADAIITQVASEQQNIVTDPLLDGWQDPARNEATDECRNWFAPVLGGAVAPNEHTLAGSLYNQTFEGFNYYLNTAFNLAALKLPYPGVPCVIGASLEPQFTAPNVANAGEVVGFNGMESNITLDAGTKYNEQGEPKPTYAYYNWNFGDESETVSGYAPGTALGYPPSPLCEEPWLEPCAASTFHSYKYGGTYEVTLTVLDVGANTASVTHDITVAGPPRPAPPAPPAPTPPAGGGTPTTTTTTGSSASSSSSGSGAGAPIVTIPGPVAAAAAMTSSLKQVAHAGLVVHYSVNEQVAGRFEVLLPATTAHGLKISGRTATGLPVGFPKSLVIGQALLVTTKGGHNSVRIKFSKLIAKRLRRAHKVTLTLRLIVHNAAKSPLSTTVTSTVVLHR